MNSLPGSLFLDFHIFTLKYHLNFPKKMQTTYFLTFKLHFAQQRESSSRGITCKYGWVYDWFFFSGLYTCAAPKYINAKSVYSLQKPQKYQQRLILVFRWKTRICMWSIMLIQKYVLKQEHFFGLHELRYFAFLKLFLHVWLILNSMVGAKPETMKMSISTCPVYSWGRFAHFINWVHIMPCQR